MYEIKNKTEFPKKFFNRIASQWVIVPASGKVESNFGFESNEIFEVTEKSKVKKDSKNNSEVKQDE